MSVWACQVSVLIYRPTFLKGQGVEIAAPDDCVSNILRNPFGKSGLISYFLRKTIYLRLLLFLVPESNS